MKKHTTKNIKKLYGIIGKPLCHSYSATYFNEKFSNEKLNYLHEPFLLDSINELYGLIANNPLLHGLNVTIPYKEQVIPFLNEVDNTAKEIGAVNVVRIETKQDGKKYLKGYNSDWYGFKKSLEPFLKDHHKKALVLGTGGASKGIIYALKNLGIDYTYVSRKADNNILSYEDLNENIIKEHKVIINTTPLGTFPNTKECPNIPYQYITNEHLVYDLVYNPIRTLFLQQAETKGAAICNGWDMFVNQAEMSFEIWER